MSDVPDLPYVCQTRGDQDMVDLARASGLSPRAAEAVASIDAVMHKVRRSIQRRDFGRRVLAKLDADLEVGHLDAISAISHQPAWSDQAQEEVTVGLLAERLGIDPSRASRLAADVVERGYARRVASQQDARRICLELTEKGERFTEAVRRNKWDLFASALGKWNEHELVVFAALLDRFSGWATDNDGVERSAENIKRILAETDAD
ncbi:MAG TPA: MarR family winged helix-turn-helix transcriptional regulator [Devosia sp.]